MGQLNVFNFITLNGFYKGLNQDISWHRHGQEEQEYATKGAQSESILLFGRFTYQMMASYWPTPHAMENAPGVAEGMNRSQKIVFSKKLKTAEWENTRIISDNIIEEIKQLKSSSDKNLTILGSGSIVSLFADHGLIDTYQIMLDPVALGDGTPIFSGIHRKLDLKLTDSKAFKSGVVLLTYVPV